MNIATPVGAVQPQGVHVFHDPVGFERFRDPACAAALWDRNLRSDVVSFLAGLEPGALPSGRLTLKPCDVRNAAAKLCADAKVPQGEVLDAFADDIADLAGRFARVMQSPYLRLRLAAVTTNACRKFHLDALTGRLVCTYRGVGTQYGASVDGGEPEHFCTAPTGAPILLRGSLWPPRPGPGLLHRSPPIEGTGQTRLVLVLDPILDAKGAE